MADVALRDKIQESLWAATRGQEKAYVAILRLLLADIRNVEIAEHKPADDAKVVGIINKQIRRHRESIEAFKQGNRSDLVSQEEAELRILMEFLPKQMSHDEIVSAAHQAIEIVGAKSPSDKGKVMSQLMPQLKGKADGREVSDIVSQLLATI